MNTRRIQMESEYVRRLLPAGRNSRRAADRALTACGLSAAGAWPVLYIRRMGEGIRQSALAEMLEVENASLVRQLNLLAEAKLVDRRPDPSDGRANLLYLTPAGHDMADRVEAIIGEVRARALSRVSDEELRHALVVLDRVAEALDDVDE